MGSDVFKELLTDEAECPFCAEVIKSRAVLCKHCGSKLPPATQPAVKPSLPTEDYIESLIRNAPKILKNVDEPTSLTGAAWRGDWAVANRLIAEGADISAANNEGHTALDLASARGYRQIVRLILSATPGRSHQRVTEQLTGSELTLKSLPELGPTNSGTLKAVISSLLALGIAWYFFGGGLHQSVTKDMERQYQISRQSGNAIDLCVGAGLVAAAYLQGHDQQGYDTWKNKERADCLMAGVPR